MTPLQFQAEALEILKNYWRIKAAIALYGASTVGTNINLEYANIPAVGITSNHFGVESVKDAISALHDFIDRRLPRDLFLALIAEFEGRLSDRLVSLGEREGGTLGNLQSKIQDSISLHPDLINDLNEVRERRNAMIHHADLADAKYVDAAAAVLPRANPHVKAVVVGENLSPTETYLTYAADVMVRYSNAIG
jgi:hypothetical protein